MEIKEHICPVCNGLEEKVLYCDYCHQPLVNGGKVSDYYDNYSPTLPPEITADYTETDNICTHIYYCPNCGYDRHYTVMKKDY